MTEEPIVKKYINLTEELRKEASVEEVLYECSKDTALHCSFFFPGRFKREFGPHHHEIFEALDNDQIRRFLLMAHRDFGKTSILQLGYASQRLLFNFSKFIVPISCSAMQAVQQSENLKMNLMTNDIIEAYWGVLRPEDKETSFSKNMWIVKVQDDQFGTIVVPRGSGQQLRGLIYGDSRPDLVLVDDLEDPENMLTDESRKNQKNWFASTLENIVDIAEDDWRIIMMGTAVHEDSILWDLIDDPEDWKSVSISLCDDNFKTLWPERFSQEKVDSIVSMHRRRSTMDSFYREYMNLPVSLEDAAFRQSYFRYYNPDSINFNKVSESMVIVDPAKTTKLHSAESGIVGVSAGTKDNKFWVREALGLKLNPNELYNETFNMALRIGANVIGVEVTSLEDFIKHPFVDAATLRGLNFTFIWLKARGKKENRVRELAYYYIQGLIEHHPTACKQLEAQLISFPNSKRWDIMDSLAYLSVMLEEGERFFSVFGSDNEDEIELEYEDLLIEDEMEVDIDGWRVY